MERGVIGGLLRSWRGLPLVRRFVLAGGVVMLAAMLVVGSWITMRIERSVIDNTAAATALYMESFISPLSQELAEADTLSEPAVRALDEMMTGTPLGERVVSFKIWKPGGLVAHASDPSIIGKTLPPTDGLRRAWQGEVAASFEDLDAVENAPEAALGLPLLEIYSPVRRVWSGEVIAVAEFYAIEDTLARDLAVARSEAWMIVAAVFALCGLSLFGIVRAGGRTIERQQARLQAEAASSREVARQNAELRQRAVGAAARAAAQTERTLRQVGADLHDGPAQYLALAALRLERALPASGPGQAEAEAIRGTLTSALAEIRGISRGLALPDLDRLTLAEVVRRAVEAHPGQDPVPVAYTGTLDPPLDVSARICVYRFLQEALSNAARHAWEAPVTVAVAVTSDVVVTVRDRGPGFDPGARSVRQDGGQGLAGLRDRAESIGGEVEIESAAGQGTVLRLRLPLEGRAS
jgi:signal transduction histidine kinase